MEGRPDRVAATLAACLAGLVSIASAQPAPPQPKLVPAPATVKAPPLPPVHKLKGHDVDDHAILINKPGTITLVLGADADSGDAARAAGKEVYPLRGRPDFQLVVVVDLRDSIANWVPSVALGQMRSNLDKEAIELKPYYLKNGNKSNPRNSTYVIADFDGSICPQLGWPDGSDDLRGILYGEDGREIKRWNKLTDYDAMFNDIREAISAFDDATAAKAAAAAKIQTSRQVQPPTPPPPLPPAIVTPPAKTN